MGYWKDNFPGSPAYYQRIRVARGVVIYSVVCGGLLFAFSPLSRTIRSTPPHTADPQWLRDKMERKMGGEPISGIVSKENWHRFLRGMDKEHHGDWTRPLKVQRQLLPPSTSLSQHREAGMGEAEAAEKTA